MSKKALCIISNLPKDIKRDMIRRALKGGQFASVQWINKKGSLSKANGRIGVTKHLKGGKNTTTHKKELLTLYRVNVGKDNSYCSVNMDTVKQLKCNGNTLNFSD